MGRRGNYTDFWSIDCRVVGRLVGAFGPDVDGVAGVAALKAVKQALRQVGAEAAGRSACVSGAALRNYDYSQLRTKCMILVK